MDIPNSVKTYLFNGIVNRIELVIKYKDLLNIKKESKEIKEAIEWYNRYCLVNGQHLWDMYHMMLQKIHFNKSNIL